MKRTALLLTCLLISSLAIADQNNKKKADTKSWKPTAFVLEADQLPAGYAGLDAKKFFKLFKSKVAEFQKKDFETSEEFNQRVANTDAILSPIKEADLYAFSGGCYSGRDTYDADTQSFQFYGPIFQPSSLTSPDWFTHVLAETINKSSYIGNNAYGVSLKVERRTGASISIAIPNTSPLFNTVLSSDTGGRYYEYHDTITMPTEKVRMLKSIRAYGAGIYSRGLCSLLVGKVSHTQIVNGAGEFKAPTINSPEEDRITEEAIPFEIKKVIYYVLKTGEIFGQRDF